MTPTELIERVASALEAADIASGDDPSACFIDGFYAGHKDATAEIIRLLTEIEQLRKEKK